MTDARAKFRIEGEDATAAAFRSAIGRAQSASKQISNAFSGAFAGLSVGLAVGFAKSMFNAADAISDAAKRAHAGADEFARLAYAANQADVDTSTLEVGVAKLSKTIGEAANGTPAAVKALADLGLKAIDLVGIPLPEKIAILSDRLKTLGSDEQRAAVAAGIMGRSVAELMPLFDQGAEATRKFSEEAHGMSERTRIGIGALDEAYKHLWDNIKGGVADALASLGLLAGGTTNELDRLELRLAALRDSLKPSAGAAMAGVRFDKAAVLKDIAETEAAIAKAKNKIAAGKDEAARKAESARIKAELVAFNAETRRIQLENIEAVEAANTKAFEELLVIEKRYYEELINDATRAADAQTELADRLALDGIDKFREQAEAAKEAMDEISTYAEEAARNIQDAFADFLFDPFKDGLRGMLLGFVNIIRRMIAEALAAQILKSLFGEKGAGGFLGSIFGGIFSGKAAGGPVNANQPYIVGERGPELFMPSSSGKIIPNNAMGGASITIAPTYNISGSGLSAQELQPILQRNNRNMAEMFAQSMHRSGMRPPVFA
jgi:hypothetical protein